MRLDECVRRIEILDAAHAPLRRGVDQRIPYGEFHDEGFCPALMDEVAEEVLR